MIDKKKVLLTIFSIVFVCGLLLVLNSWSLGDFCSRQYNDIGWMTNPEEVKQKAISYMVTGLIISLISGFGLVLTIIKTHL